jgi:hypothetical protein
VTEDWSGFNFWRFFRGNPEGIARLRLGRGVVGNTTHAFWGSCLLGVGAVFALRDNPWATLAALFLIAAMYLIYMFATHRFADKHPDRAMLGDAEWLAWAQSQTAAKDFAALPASPTTIDPASDKVLPPPGIIDAS